MFLQRIVRRCRELVPTVLANSLNGLVSINNSLWSSKFMQNSWLLSEQLELFYANLERARNLSPTHKIHILNCMCLKLLISDHFCIKNSYKVWKTSEKTKFNTFQMQKNWRFVIVNYLVLSIFSFNALNK